MAGHIRWRHGPLSCLNGFLCIALLFGFATKAGAQSRADWRFFTSSDGLKESWTTSITIGASGRLWINHGDVDEITVYDGYSFQRFPSPGSSLQIYESRFEELWAAGIGQSATLKRFADDEWINYEIPECAHGPDRVEAFAPHPLNPGQVLFLYPNCLVTFNIETREKDIVKTANETGLKSFIDLIVTEDGILWITGEHGLAQAVLANTGNGHSAVVQWQEHLPPDSLQVSKLRAPHRISDIEFYLIADSEQDGKDAVLHYFKNRWEQIPFSDNKKILAGWRGHDHKLWILADSSQSIDLFSIEENKTLLTRRSRVLMGEYRDLEIEQNGVFWLATTLGLARHTPPLWRNVDGLGGLRRLCLSICEDSQGSIWFGSSEGLTRLHDEKWDHYTLPNTMQPSPYMPQSLIALPNNKILVGVTDGKLVVFDPEQECFELIEHPNEHFIGYGWPQHQKEVWLQTATINGDVAIETYDGVAFKTIIPKIDTESLGNIRFVLQSKAGDIWLGGLKGVAVYRQGKLRNFGIEDGYTGYGTFAILELDDNELWFGGRDKILSYKAGTWQVIRDRGLETVKSMGRLRDGTIWVASGTGAHLCHKGTWIDYATADGLPDAPVWSVFEDSQSRIWAATGLGVRRYHSNADRNPPETSISNDENYRRIAPGAEARFVYSGKDKWDVTVPERLLFSHRIDGGPWSPFASSTSTSIKGLSHGEHTFEVRAMDRNFQVDLTPEQYSFLILLPWYREPAFILIALAGSVVIILLLWNAVLRYGRMELLVTQRTADLIAANKSLRSEIDERELLEEQLRQSQKMEAVGHLAGGIAHDFNNLLQAILGYTQMALRETSTGENLRRDLQQVKKAAQRAATLTRQLLAFSRRQILQPVDISLNETIADLAKMLQRLIGEHIELCVISAPNLGTVHADPGTIEQVIVNLCVNARDAMPKGGRLTIETKNIAIHEDFIRNRPWAKIGSYVQLTIADTGSGMTEEVLEHIYEPFYTTKEVGQGTGLGLATVYGIIKQHDGMIDVTSQVGHGTVFHIYLPRVERAPEAETTVEEQTCPGGTETILIVEDEDLVRAVAVRVLEANGYKILTAVDGEEGIRVFKENQEKIDLVLLDIVLPKIQGGEVQKQIVEMKPGIRVLLSSGYDPNDTGARHVSETDNTMLFKPYEPVQLLKRVREILDSPS